MTIRPLEFGQMIAAMTRHAALLLDRLDLLVCLASLVCT